jgi:hypothetical protein
MGFYQKDTQFQNDYWNCRELVAKSWLEDSFGINLTLQIDSISAEKTAIICEAIQKLPTL